MKRLLYCQAVAALGLVLAASSAYAATIGIADTQSNIGTFFGNHTTTVLFDPLTGPVTVTGSVDISGLQTTNTGDNSVLFVGLIAKDRYDAFAAGTDPVCPGCTTGSNFFGFLETAFAGFLYTDSGGFTGRTGQQVGFPGENLQGGVGTIPATLTDGQFQITFDATGITLDVLGSSFFQAYQNTARGPTDFTNGAYAFAGAFMNRSGAQTTFDLTFSGPEKASVPEPASIVLLVGGLAAAGIARRRKSSR